MPVFLELSGVLDPLLLVRLPFGGTTAEVVVGETSIASSGSGAPGLVGERGLEGRFLVLSEPFSKGFSLMVEGRSSVAGGMSSRQTAAWTSCKEDAAPGLMRLEGDWHIRSTSA